MKTVCFFPAHPAQLWMMYAISRNLEGKAKSVWVLRTKDVLVPLADALGLRYTVVSKARTGIIGNLWELLGNVFRLSLYTRRKNVDLWCSLYGAANLVAAIFRRPSLSFSDDDYDVVPLVAHSSYPFANAVLVTDWTRMGPYENKAVRYRAFKELFYLHPSRFTADRNVLKKLGIDEKQRYIFVRLSALTAHHDIGIRGISENIVLQLLDQTPEDVRVFISSEGHLPESLSKHALKVRVDEIHHVLAFSSLVFADSQTMIAEAAVLGRPSIRLNDFVGRIGYLDALEKYGLCYGFHPEEADQALSLAQQLLQQPGTLQRHAQARAAMLQDTIDPLPFCTEIINRYLVEE